MSHPERIVPDETERGIVALHVKRYEFASAYCLGKVVLDAACGVGYGTAHLARVAAHVTGVDVDREAIAYARRRYAADNVSFEVMDATALAFDDAAFDVVCSFETIEHLDDRDAYLAGVARVLRPDGVFVVSTPRAERTTTSPANPHHRVEYAADDFERLLRTRFAQVELHGQRRRTTTRHRLAQRLDVLGLRRRLRLLRRASGALVGTRATDRLTLDDVTIELGRLDGASELVAVCTSPLP